MTFVYQKVGVQRSTFPNFWDFAIATTKIIAVLILVSEGRDKKGGFVETHSSEYSISKSKMQDIFEIGLASHRIK